MGKIRANLKLYVNALGRLRHSKGFGIHSPFAFNFVLRVLREKWAYYAYSDIESMRDCLQRIVDEMPGEHPRLISLKNAKMLFRIACYFNPKAILQIGASYGLSTTAVLEVSSKSKLVIYKGKQCYGEIFDQITHSVSERIESASSIAEAFSLYRAQNSDNGVPFLMVNSFDDDSAVEECLGHASSILDKEGVVVVRNLLVDERVVQFVRRLVVPLEYGMSFTNGRLLVIVAYKHLPRQRFNLWF
ncbi:MAG: hypothetical protein NC127_01475 [Muribaculum sp.]|nr:hypothetical protein [Muribaculum sp.]